MLDLGKVAGLLVSLKAVGERRRTGCRDEASQQAEQRKYGPHRGACRRTMRV